MIETTDNASAPCELEFARPDNKTLVVRMAGSWTLKNKCPPADRVLKEISSGSPAEHIAFDAAALTDWDSGFLIFLTRVTEACSKEGAPTPDMKGLPEGARKLLALAETVPEKKGTGKGTGRASFLSRVGEETLDFFRSSLEILAFIGEASIAFSRFLAGKARFRGSDLTRILQECGIEALRLTLHNNSNSEMILLLFQRSPLLNNLLKFQALINPTCTSTPYFLLFFFWKIIKVCFI